MTIEETFDDMSHHDDETDATPAGENPLTLIVRHVDTRLFAKTWTRFLATNESFFTHILTVSFEILRSTT